MKTVDFPAGHSMDTDWFAVDKDGNVAVFDSDQEGAVPIEIEGQTNRLELFEKYATPITPVLRRLFLDEKVVENILQKCDYVTLIQIMEKEYFTEGCIVLLNEGKKWEDLNFEEKISKEKSDFAICLSQNIPLYLISGIYSIRNELIAAIKNKVIIQACKFDRYSETCYEGVGIGDLGIYVYDHEYPDGRTEPYCNAHTPEFPLKANQIAPDLAEKIPHFKEITFEHQYYIQPMEFFSCESYGLHYEAKNEYAKVTSSDKEKVYCLLPVSSQIYNLMNLGNCKRCFHEEKSSLYHYDLRTYQDYPPIIIIEDYNLHHYRKREQYNSFLNFIYNCLNICNKDCFITYCAKCYSREENEKYQEADYLLLSEKFQNCYQHFNTEVSVLQPVLLIAIDDTVINLLKTKYEVTGFSGASCICGITIENKQYPLLAVNNAKTKKEQTILTKYLSGISEEIKVILAKPRNLPPPKPRVIQIEDEDDEDE